MQKTLLICDDEENTRNLLQYVLMEKGYRVFESASILQALSIIENESINIVITDMILGNENGMDLLKKIKKLKLQTPVIFLTAYGTIQSAVQAMTEGAFHYLLKPINYEELFTVIAEAEEKIEMLTQNTYLKEEISRLRDENIIFIAESAAMRTLVAEAEKIARSDAPVLLQGDSGTGKEVLANFIHKNSSRAEKTFAVVNCAAVSAELLESELFGHEKGSLTGAVKTKHGKFEIAEGGTIFLDEISELPHSIQLKLLRFLETGEIERLGALTRTNVDTRIIASSNHALARAVEDGTVRSDLYYRLNAMPLTIPPLRERRADIRPLVKHFIKEAQKKSKHPLRIDEQIFEYLERYAWPGNIRELKNLIERLAMLHDEITVETLPDEVLKESEDIDLKRLPLSNLSLKNIEREAIRQTLLAVKGNRRKAADILEITRQTLYAKIKDYTL